MLIFVFVVPLMSDQFGKLSLAGFVVALVLLCGYPFALIAHYRLFTPNRRPPAEDINYWRLWEVVCVIVTVLIAVVFICYFVHHHALPAQTSTVATLKF